MARASAPLPPAFAQLEQRLASLIDLYNRGQLTFQNYQSLPLEALCLHPKGCNGSG